MMPQIFFSISYVAFVIFIAMSCLYKGKTAMRLKILSAVCVTVATGSYIIFLKDII